jgi:hypothetical protein
MVFVKLIIGRLLTIPWHFRLPIRMYHRGPHWTGFFGIWYSIVLWKNLPRKFQILFQSDKNIGQFTWRPKYVTLLPAKLNSAHKHSCATLDICILLTVICSSVLHTECIVVFPVKQWLSERATILYVCCLHCYEIPLVSVTKICWTIPVFSHIRSQWGPLPLSHKFTFFVSYLYNMKIMTNY